LPNGNRSWAAYAFLVTSPVGLRERKKTATRQALHEAAVRLAVERGVDNVTIEAIADAAGVSRRTFSNYFAGKEQALLYGDETRIRRLLDLVHARPAAESPWTALTRAAEELAVEDLAVEGDDDVARMTQIRLLRRHPALLAQQVATYAAAERELAAELSSRMVAGEHGGRMSPDEHGGRTASDEVGGRVPPGEHGGRTPGDGAPLRARLFAAAFLTTLRVATQTWLDQPEGPLVEAFRQALAITRERFR
jgi:AcrR family transcriptional regulator